MLVDSITLVNTGKVERKLSTVGKTFPLNPTDLQMYEIADSVIPANGVYIYSAGIAEWVLAENNAEGPYDIALTVFDRPRSLDIIAKHLAARTFVIAPNFEGAMAAANINATDNTLFSIYRTKAGIDTLIGTLRFLPGVTNGIFTTVGSSNMVIARGQTLKFVAPELRDATLSSIDITLSAKLLTYGV